SSATALLILRSSRPSKSRDFGRSGQRAAKTIGASCSPSAVSMDATSTDASCGDAISGGVTCAEGTYTSWALATSASFSCCVRRAGPRVDVPSRARDCAFIPLSLRNQHRWLSRGLTRYNQWVPGGADEPGLVLHPFGSARLTCAPNKTVA